MEFKKIEALTDVAEGDIIIINAGYKPELHTVQKVKVTERDGTELILKNKGNIYFNLGMFLDGKSWVREAYLVK